MMARGIEGGGGVGLVVADALWGEGLSRGRGSERIGFGFGRGV